MLNFCTLFDSRYLSRGLALYDSLEQQCSDFHFYIFAFDDKCLSILRNLNLKYATIISLKEFENEKLLEIKQSRTRGEYCWTCTPSIILYVLNNYNVNHCTYLDADIYFFSSPQVLIDEMEDKSILITPHRYTKRYDQSERTGIYCVQFVTFKKNKNGLIALNWWCNACLEWCYNRIEDGKFGDQKYLDDWPTRFEGVHVLQHLGGGVAPWNMQQYTFQYKDDKILGKEITTSKRFNVIFFHFHSLTFINSTCFSPRPYYQRNNSVIKLIFNPYIKKILQIRKEYPVIASCEHYLSGIKKIKYLIEVFVRRGFKEIHSIHLLHR